ncbi:hypothetical protein HPB47_009682 [Ixodes persulcatus]|uniref:Uncharacterized protein n=1 Tax=Ixodes persulcatus TaxID=34615 RepID=A0AC60P1D8_IXOPE|nr:hypothetical protein HPB47_009682 [Ixodes persulcatus]
MSTRRRLVTINASEDTRVKLPLTVHLKVIQFLIRGYCSSRVLLTLGLLNLHCLASLGRRLGNLDVPGGPTTSLRLGSDIPCNLLPQRNRVLANQVGFPNKW